MHVRDVDLLTAFHHGPLGVVVVRPDGVVVACNPAMGRLLRRDCADVVGLVLFDVVHPDDLEDARRWCAQMLTGEMPQICHECRWVVDGRVVWVSVSVSRVPRYGDRQEHAVIYAEDITERRQREAELSHQALHDPLTGLANRTLLLERIREALSRHGRHARPSHLFYLDLDGFKAVNDRFGHVAGDAVLVQLAQRIVTLLRNGDTAARLGGDEFAVLCEDTEPQHATTIAERLRAAAAIPFSVDGVQITLSASVGSYPARVADPGELLRRADRRMYEWKRRGAGAVVPEPRPASSTDAGS